MTPGVDLLADIRRTSMWMCAWRDHAAMSFEDSEVLSNLLVPVVTPAGLASYTREWHRTRREDLSMFATSFALATTISAITIYDAHEDEFRAADPRASFGSLCCIAAQLRDRMRKLCTETAATAA